MGTWHNLLQKGGDRTPPKDYWEALAQVVAELPEQFAVAVGGTLTGLNLKRSGDTWLLVVKTRSVQRGELVAFFGGYSPGDCFEQLEAALRTRPGIDWRTDKFVK